MSILLFGATGQLGSSLAATCVVQHIDCAAPSRKDCDFATVSRDALAALVEKHKPSVLINAAAWAAVDDAEVHKEETQRVNAIVPGWLGELAAKHRIPLMHFSTDYVFDGLRDAPYKEDSKTNPINHYGATKLAGERLLMRSKAQVFIFRLQLLYQESGNSFFCRMRQLLGERESLRVAADQISAPTSVGEVSDAVMKAIPMIKKDTLPAGVYHMAADGHTSRHGFVLAIRDEMLTRGIPVKTTAIEPIVSEEFPTPALRPKDTRLSTEKLAAQGIVLPHWREGLKKVMDKAHENN